MDSREAETDGCGVGQRPNPGPVSSQAWPSCKTTQSDHCDVGLARAIHVPLLPVSVAVIIAIGYRRRAAQQVRTSTQQQNVAAVSIACRQRLANRPLPNGKSILTDY